MHSGFKTSIFDLLYMFLAENSAKYLSNWIPLKACGKDGGKVFKISVSYILTPSLAHGRKSSLTATPRSTPWLLEPWKSDPAVG